MHLMIFHKRLNLLISIGLKSIKQLGILSGISIINLIISRKLPFGTAIAIYTAYRE